MYLTHRTFLEAKMHIGRNSMYFAFLFWYMHEGCKCLTARMVPGIWSTWRRSTWRNTMCETGSEWLLQTRIEVFTNWGTSTLLRMRERKKISCLIILFACVLFTLFLYLAFFLANIAWDTMLCFYQLQFNGFDHLRIAVLLVLNWEQRLQIILCCFSF